LYSNSHPKSLMGHGIEKGEPPHVKNIIQLLHKAVPEKRRGWSETYVDGEKNKGHK